MVDRELMGVVAREHAGLERMLTRAMIARAAADYRHRLRHGYVESCGKGAGGEGCRAEV